MTQDRPSSEVAAQDGRKGSLPELAIVFGLTVGVPLVSGLAAGRIQSFDFSQSRLLGTLTAEAVVVALLWPWLAKRGWSFRSIAGAPEPVDLVRGLVVALLAYVAFYISAITWAV